MAMTGAAVLVRLKEAGEPVFPEKFAVTLKGPPTIAFAVNVEAVAIPLVFVLSVSLLVPLLKAPLAPVAGAVNVTETPLTGLPSLSMTVACSAVAKAAPTIADCVAPAVALIDAGLPAVFDMLKEAGVVAPVVDAETLYDPAVVPAVNVDAVATPWAFVVTVSVAVPPEKVPLAPLAGAVNVTDAPLNGDEPFITVTDNDVAKAVPTVALCEFPPLTAIVVVFDFDPPHPMNAEDAPNTRMRSNDPCCFIAHPRCSRTQMKLARYGSLSEPEPRFRRAPPRFGR